MADSQTQGCSLCSFMGQLLLLALQIAQIVIGAKYLNECSQQHYIPFFLVVGGVFGIIILLSSCLTSIHILCFIWMCLVTVFGICWFIAGSVWIYTIYPPNYNSTVDGVPYCNKTLYQFAYWIITLAYLVLAIALVKICCLAIFLKICMAKMGSTGDTEN